MSTAIPAHCNKRVSATRTAAALTWSANAIPQVPDVNERSVISHDIRHSAHSTHVGEGKRQRAFLVERVLPRVERSRCALLLHRAWRCFPNIACVFGDCAV